MFTCTEQIQELAQTLNYPKIKKALTQPVDDYLRFVLRYSTQISIDKRFDRVPDLKDNYLFHLAYSAKSYFLVSGDTVVRNMKQVNKISIISMAELRAMLA